MTEFFQRLRDAFCYCGLSKEEYNSIKRDLYASNFMVWKYVFVLMMVSNFVIMTVALVEDGRISGVGVRMGMIIFSSLICFLFFSVFQADSKVAQGIIYLSMLLLLVSAMYVGLRSPDAMGVAFFIMLVLLPMIVLDKPWFMTLVIVTAVTAYLVAGSHVKTPEMFSHDLSNTIFFGILGILVNVFYNSIRVRELILRRRSWDYSEDQRSANEEMRRLNSALKKMSESVVDLLGDVVEYRDNESGEHVHRVKGYTYILANQVMEDLPEYGLDPYTIDLITFTSTLHDVGKIAVPDAILCKPGKLTPEEFEIMKTHSQKGCDIVSKMADKWSRDYVEMGMDICLYHHEKWDGRGYPKGLKGDEIPIAAQIVSVADVYDALTTKRVYKDASTCDEAFYMILNGECGAFSDKLMACFVKCREKFEANALGSCALTLPDRDYELVSKTNPEESFVIGLHDQDRTLRERVRLDEELSVLGSLSEEFYYVCYVDMAHNEITRFKADSQFARIIDSYGNELPSNERFDKLLNSLIVAEDYKEFRAATERERAMEQLKRAGHFSVNFRIRLESGVHHCRMRLSLDRSNPNVVIIGLSNRDEAYEKEMEYQRMEIELEAARRVMEDQELLADRLAVIDCISGEYDYVCSLNADTMEVTVYRAEAWIRDMFKNLEDLVKSPEARDKTLKGIIHPEDFRQFQQNSRHEAVMRALGQSGNYQVNYRAYVYGRLVRYQTRYALDRNNPKRIIIGLRSLGDGVRG